MTAFEPPLRLCYDSFLVKSRGWTYTQVRELLKPVATVETVNVVQHAYSLDDALAVEASDPTITAKGAAIAHSRSERERKAKAREAKATAARTAPKVKPIGEAKRRGRPPLQK